MRSVFFAPAWAIPSVVILRQLRKSSSVNRGNSSNLANPASVMFTPLSRTAPNSGIAARVSIAASVTSGESRKSTTRSDLRPLNWAMP